MTSHVKVKSFSDLLDLAVDLGSWYSLDCTEIRCSGSVLEISGVLIFY